MDAQGALGEAPADKVPIRADTGSAERASAVLHLRLLHGSLENAISFQTPTSMAALGLQLCSMEAETGCFCLHMY